MIFGPQYESNSNLGFPKAKNSDRLILGDPNSILLHLR